MPDIIGTLLTTPRRPLASSALPDAPVVDDADHWARQAVVTALRALGRGSRRLGLAPRAAAGRSVSTRADPSATLSG